jgi:hypothetical protein
VRIFGVYFTSFHCIPPWRMYICSFFSLFLSRSSLGHLHHNRAHHRYHWAASAETFYYFKNCIITALPFSRLRTRYYKCMRKQAWAVFWSSLPLPFSYELLDTLYPMISYHPTRIPVAVWWWTLIWGGFAFSFPSPHDRGLCLQPIRHRPAVSFLLFVLVWGITMLMS